MPNVDMQIEPMVREAFAAAVQRHDSRFEDALKDIPQEHVEEVLKLAFAVDAYIVRSIFEGPPSGEDLDELAAEFIVMEDWYPAAELPYTTFFRMLGNADHPSLPDNPARFALLCFLAGGWLLAAFLDDGKDWVDHLDNVLNALDAEPTSS